MISIVDYGTGNLRSVQKALEKVGYTSRITQSLEEVEQSDLLVVPGVGAFDRAVQTLRNLDLWSAIRDHLQQGKPYLGICLGLQLLFEGSEEGTQSGLGFFQGQVRRLEDVRLVPHMGWNDVRWRGPGRELAPDSVKHPCYYFVHSYYPVPETDSIVAGYTDYGGPFCSAVRQELCFGVQFHPEKSQFAGLALLESICQRCLPAASGRATS